MPDAGPIDPVTPNSVPAMLPEAEVAHTCANCGAPVQDRFCPHCGQSTHVHQSLLHLVEEVLHGLWHFEAKSWRTLPLLILWPGELTRRFVDGQRVRFVSPMGLYLFMIFAMFFSYSLLNGHDSTHLNVNPAQTRQEVLEETRQEISGDQAALAKAESALNQARQSGSGVEDETEDVADARRELQGDQDRLARISALNDKASEAELLAAMAEVPATGKNQAETSTRKRIIGWASYIKNNREMVAYKAKNNAYKFALILVPLSMPFLWLMFFWRKGASMFVHAVFCLYSISFMALLAIVVEILAYFGMSWLSLILGLLVPPWHMFRQLKGAYGLSNGAALWRALVLAWVAFMMLIVYGLFVVVLSAQ